MLSLDFCVGLKIDWCMLLFVVVVGRKNGVNFGFLLSVFILFFVCIVFRFSSILICVWGIIVRVIMLGVICFGLVVIFLKYFFNFCKLWCFFFSFFSNGWMYTSVSLDFLFVFLDVLCMLLFVLDFVCFFGSVMEILCLYVNLVL